MKNLVILFIGVLILVSASTKASEQSLREDKSHWEQEDFLIETAHPYENNSVLSWLLVKHEARLMAIHFEKLDTERNRDYLEIRDDQNNLVQIIDGSREDFYSNSARTKYLKIKFFSNSKNSMYGFKIDRIAWK